MGACKALQHQRRFPSMALLLLLPHHVLSTPGLQQLEPSCIFPPLRSSPVGSSGPAPSTSSDTLLGPRPPDGTQSSPALAKCFSLCPQSTRTSC